MARFSLQYHVHGKTDFTPTESIDAETIEEAAAYANKRVSGSEAVAVSHDEEMVVIPLTQIQYVSIRTVVERRAARPAVRDFDLDIVEPWNSGQTEETTT
jgi:RNA polymerase-interacting CarD/CdnL/TRCF family regulator